jgi:hypothetical protein
MNDEGSRLDCNLLFSTEHNGFDLTEWVETLFFGIKLRRKLLGPVKSFKCTSGRNLSGTQFTTSLNFDQIEHNRKEHNQLARTRHNFI